MTPRALRLVFAGVALTAAAELPPQQLELPGVGRVEVKDEGSAKEWLETLKGFSETFGSEAKLFENLNGEESSKAWSHSFALIGCLGDLVSGFLGDATSEYVQAIAELQKEFDSALSAIQQQLNQLIQALEADFLKAFLAPKSVILKGAVSALTQYSHSDKSKVPKNVWKAQMEPIAERVAAWNAMASCLTFGSVSCPGDLYDIVLADGQSYQRPAVLAAFAGYHYSLLSSSAAAICAYQKLEDPSSACSFIDVSMLQKVSKTMSDAVTKMKGDFFNSMGGDMLPPLLQAAVDGHANQGYDGACAIRDQIQQELQSFYFDQDLISFFGISSWAVSVYQDVSGGDKHWMWASGWKYRYNGYNIMYNFGGGESFSYSDNDCRDGDAHNMAQCLHDMHNGSPWVLHTNAFWAAVYNSAYFHSYGGGDVRLVVPGSSATAGTVAVEFEGLPEEPASEGNLVAPPGQFEGVVVPLASRAAALRDVPSDPEAVLKDISNIFATAGAIADFFGPEGEVVGLVLDFIAAIFSLFSTLLGLGKPDPVIEALRALEKDVMGRLSAVSDTVARARQVAAKGSLALVLDSATQPLVDIVGFWNALYPNGSKGGKLNQAAVNTFKQVVMNDMSKYRDSWNTLAQCLAGTNTDCIFDNQNALQVLMYDGQTFQRPVILTQIVQYYFILLQKSSVAICAAAHLFLQDDKCTFMIDMSTHLQAVGKAMSAEINAMKQRFFSEMGSDQLTPMMQYYVDQHANQGYDGAVAIRDAVQNELQSTHFADGLESSLGVSSWAFSAYQDVSGGDKHWMWASGWKYRYNGYNVMYNFANGPAATYGDNDCRDGDAHNMAQCLHDMHQASPWVLHGDYFWASVWSAAYEGNFGSDVRIVVPGAKGALGSPAVTSKQHPGADAPEPLLVV